MAWDVMNPIPSGNRKKIIIPTSFLEALNMSILLDTAHAYFPYAAQVHL